jgi:hypothetical protein
MGRNLSLGAPSARNHSSSSRVYPSLLTAIVTAKYATTTTITTTTTTTTATTTTSTTNDLKKHSTKPNDL